MDVVLEAYFQKKKFFVCDDITRYAIPIFLRCTVARKEFVKGKKHEQQTTNKQLIFFLF